MKFPWKKDDSHTGNGTDLWYRCARASSSFSELSKEALAVKRWSHTTWVSPIRSKSLQYMPVGYYLKASLRGFYAHNKQKHCVNSHWFRSIPSLGLHHVAPPDIAGLRLQLAQCFSCGQAEPHPWLNQGRLKQRDTSWYINYQIS